MNVLNQLIDSAQRWAMYQGDCVETLRGIPDNSIHYSIFSPPFASLYTYSNSDRDMGNSSDGAEFVQHFGYLVAELYRVIMPGRLVSIHCMNLPAMKSRDGFIGIKDFRGDIIREMTEYGFIFHSEVCIWKTRSRRCSARKPSACYTSKSVRILRCHVRDFPIMS